MGQAIPLRTIAGRGILAVGLTLLVNVTILELVRASGIVEPFGALTVPPVAFLSVLGAIAATAVYGAVTRIYPRPDWIFLRVAAIALLISFIPDVLVLLYDETASLGAVLVLMVMHVTAAGICVIVLTDRYGPQPIGAR